MKILVVNSGSSSIKYQVFALPEGTVLAKGLLERIGEDGSHLKHTIMKNGAADTSEQNETVKNHADGMKIILQYLTDEKHGVVKDIHEIGAVGHRVVHGGETYAESTVINDDVIKTIEAYADLAPLHNPPNLTGIRATMKALGDTPQVACFDTAFHQTIPKYAYLYAIPYELYEQYKIRRYGFHGTSHRYVTNEAIKALGKNAADTNIITCHLGNGGSMTAVRGGKSVDTTMGLTPLEGLVMGTRSGDIDPAIVFYLNQKTGMSCSEMNTLFNKKGGLLGISGISNDMRNLMDEAENGKERAALAIDMFCYRVRKYVGAYMTVLGRVDAVIFTGGIGENNPSLRKQMLDNLSFFGIEIDDARNNNKADDTLLISTDKSKIRVYVIPTDEEKAIAFDTYALTKDA